MSALYYEKQKTSGGNSEQSIRCLDEKLDMLDSLTDELVLLWDNTTEGNCDENKIDEILAKMDAVDAVKPFDTKNGLAEFHRDYEELFEDAKITPPIKIDERPKRKLRPMFRRVFPVAAALAIVFGSMISAQALGFDVFGSIARWTDEVFSFESNDAFVPASIRNRPYTTEESVSFQSMRDIIDSFDISSKIAPNWLPEEFSDASAAANYTAYIRPDDGVEISAFFCVEDKSLTLCYTESDSPNAMNVIIEKENSEPILYTKNSIGHYIVCDLELSKIVWANGCFECSISGMFTYDEAIQMIDSIYL